MRIIDLRLSHVDKTVAAQVKAFEKYSTHAKPNNTVLHRLGSNSKRSSLKANKAMERKEANAAVVRLEEQLAGTQQEKAAAQQKQKDLQQAEKNLKSQIGDLPKKAKGKGREKGKVLIDLVTDEDVAEREVLNVDDDTEAAAPPPLYLDPASSSNRNLLPDFLNLEPLGELPAGFQPDLSQSEFDELFGSWGPCLD
ncbi:hypothetical protein SISNIDRAFT_471228 [Sistotremastrum niveocremeum HHB9708]|uniref:Uncharacterized protein n=2 Tax=Sistotremastraceae TaxID=3402574 RepID=A0A164MX70_9AGAM|nr:hypothetical protein SISNIDRAFT_471228 [Sistotremastrum niveocremeum HHB9708]KZT32811.1 hypothetical protein SISSUDRAFT_1066645 [Sistotremastrum suecicum HHB10207 ss-3]